MRPLRYSINVTLDGCCDHRAIIPDEELHRHAVENLDQADALLFGRVTYEMMEAAFRPPAQTGARPDWMEPFARTIDAAKKYVVSSTLDRVDWNAELVRGDLGKAVQRLKQEPGKALFRLVDESTVWVDAKLPSGTVSRIEPGSPAIIVVGGERINAKVLRSAHRTSDATRIIPATLVSGSMFGYGGQAARRDTWPGWTGKAML